MLALISFVESYRPVNLTHSGGCDPQSSGYIDDFCTLPIDANITLIPQSGSAGDPVGVGVKVDANISIDVYARRTGSPPAYTYTPALQYQENIVGTIIRIIFPPGFLLCPSTVMLQGNTMILGDESAATGMKLGPLPNTSFKQISPFTKGSTGIREPAPGQLLRVGTYSGALDPTNYQTRCFEINITSNASITTSVPNVTQRITFIISNILTYQTVGAIPSPVDAGAQQVFAIQIYQISKGQGGTTAYNMRFYNNRINDIRLDPSKYFWFRSTFVGASILSSNTLCPACAAVSFNPTKLGSTSTANFSITNLSPIPNGGILRILFPALFSLGAVPLSQVTVSAVNTIVDGNLWGPFNATIQGSLLLVARTNNVNSVPIFSGSTITLIVPSILIPNPSKASVSNVFQATISTGANSGNFTFDSGIALFPTLTPSDMQGVSVSLSSYKVGSYPVSINISFFITQTIVRDNVIFVRVPIDDITFPSGSPSFYSDGSFYTMQLENISQSYLELRYYVNTTLKTKQVTVSVGLARNRGFAGPSSLPFLVGSRIGLNSVESAAANLSQPFEPNTLAFLNVFVTPSPTPSTLVNFSFRFQVTNPIPSTGVIAVLLPRAFTVSTATTIYTTFDSSLVSVANQFSVVMVSADTSNVLISLNIPVFQTPYFGFVSLNITQVQCPNYVITDVYTTVSTYYSALLTNQIDNSSSAIVMTPNILYITSLSVLPPQAGASGSIVVNFVLSDDLPLDGKVVFVFPEDYVVSRATIGSSSSDLTDCCGFSGAVSNPNVALIVDGQKVQIQLFSPSYFLNKTLNSISRTVLLRCDTYNLSSCIPICSTAIISCLSGFSQNFSGYSPLLYSSRNSTIVLNAIRFPLHGGYSGGLKAFTSTAANNTIDVTSASIPFPDLLVGSLQNLIVVFNTTIVGQSGAVAISFKLQSAISKNASIAVTFPSAYVCKGGFSVSIVSNKSVVPTDISASICDGTNAIEFVLNPTINISAGSSVEIRFSNVRNTYFPGASDSIIVESRTMQYIVDRGKVAAPNLTPSLLSDVKVNISSVQGGEPQAGQEVSMLVQLRADLPVPLSRNGRIVLLLEGTGLEFPADQDSVTVEFMCENSLHLSQYCTNSTTESQLGTILPCPKCYFPDALASVDGKNIILEYHEWSILPERQRVQPIDVPPGYTLVFEVQHLLAASSSQQMKDLLVQLQGIGPNSPTLQVFESSLRIALPFIMPCSLKNESISQTSRTGAILSFSLCQSLNPRNLIQFSASCWIDCNLITCDAYNSINCFRIPRGSTLNVKILPNPDAWHVNLSSDGINTNLQMQSSLQVLSNTSVTVSFTGIEIPLIPGLSSIPYQFVINLTNNSSLCSTGTVSSVALVPRKQIWQTCYVSFLSGMDVANQNGALGIAFILGSESNQIPSKLLFGLSTMFTITQLNVYDLIINNSAVPGLVSFTSVGPTVTGTNITISLTSYSSLFPGTLIQFKISGFKNPFAGSYMLPGFWVLGATGNNVIDQLVNESYLIVKVMPRLMANASLESTSSSAGELCNISVTFISQSALSLGDKLVVFSSGGIKATDSIGMIPPVRFSYQNCSVPYPALQICFTVTQALSEQSLIKFTIFGLKNFPYSSSQVWSIRTLNSLGSTLDIADSFATINVQPGPASGSINLENSAVGGIGTVAVFFTAFNPLYVGDFLKIRFPGGVQGFSFTRPAEIVYTGGLNETFTQLAASVIGVNDLVVRLISNGNQSANGDLAVVFGPIISFVTDRTLRAPLRCGMADAIVIESYTKVLGIDTLVDSCTVNILIYPSILISPQISVASVHSRAGLSLDTKQKNNATVSFITNNSISLGSFVAIRFPVGLAMSLQQADPGCSARDIFSCIDTIICMQGCSESLVLSRNRSFVVVMQGKVQNMTFDLVTQIKGKDLPAGTLVTLLIRTFGIPPRSIGPTGLFIISTITSEGYAVDLASANGFEILPGTLQNLNMPVLGTFLPVPSLLSCSSPQPIITYSDTTVNNSFFFPFIAARLTSSVQNGYIYLDIPRSAISYFRSGAYFTVSASVCPPKQTILQENSYAYFNDSDCVYNSYFSFVNTSDALYIRLVLINTSFAEDSTLIIWNLGGNNSDQNIGLRNRIWAGELDFFRFISAGWDGATLDLSIFAPMSCVMGQLKIIEISEIVIPMSSGLCMSNVIAGGSGNISLRMQAPLQISSNVTLRVYLPVGFSITNAIAKLQSYTLWTAKYNTSTKTDLSGSSDKSNRTVFELDVQGVTSFKVNDTFSFDFGTLNNPSFATNYPMSSVVTGESKLTIQFLSIVQGTNGAQLRSNFRFEWTIATVPRTLQNVSVLFESFAVAENQRINISFVTRASLSPTARFVLWFPIGSGIDLPSAGFDFLQAVSSIKLSNYDSRSFSNIKLGSLLGSIQPGMMPADIANPIMCNSNSGLELSGNFALFQKNCTYNTPCSPLASSQSSFSMSSLYLQRSLSSISNSSFLVPMINGKLCNVTEPIVAMPGDWIIPAGCNISQPYLNTSVVLQYQIPLDAIPAGSLVTLILDNIRNPLRFINCSGWFDIQVQEKTPYGWSLSQRGLRGCQAYPSRGVLRGVQAFLSNTKAGLAVLLYQI